MPWCLLTCPPKQIIQGRSSTLKSLRALMGNSFVSHEELICASSSAALPSTPRPESYFKERSRSVSRRKLSSSSLRSSRRGRRRLPKPVALVCGDRNTAATDICMLDVATRTISRFTFDRSPNAEPLWTPDGTHVLFGALHDGRWGFYRKAASGAGSEDLIFQPEGNQTYIGGITSPSASRFTVVEIAVPRRNHDLWLVPLSGSAVPFLQTKFSETHGDLSPDGHWIAYASDESGTMEVYVRPFPAGSGKWQLSQGGGDGPRWRRDGRELFYVVAGKRFVAVPINMMKGELQPGAPSTLFDIPKSKGEYAVAADGQRFLITVNVDDALQSSTTVVLNWAAGLRH